MTRIKQYEFIYDFESFDEFVKGHGVLDNGWQA